MAIDLNTERIFGEVSLEGGHVTLEQLQKCEKIFETTVGTDEEKRLGEIMIAKGLINKPQALSILKIVHGRRGDKPRIGGYELISKLGAGAMGIVYKARQLSMDRMVALKLLPRKFSEDEAAVERFMREAQTLARLNHRNVVSAIDVGQASGYHYFAMELVDGESYELVIKRDKIIDPETSLDVAVQVVQGLEHAAEIGITHRDIKPGNIMRCTDGTVKIADMGLAVAQDEASGSVVKRAGTPYYMSPEQVECVQDIDFRADIYALGATLFEMVTSHKPFTGHSTTAIMTKRLSEEPPQAHIVNPEVSKGFSAIIYKMMACDRDERFDDFGTLLYDLNLVANGKQPVCISVLPGHVSQVRMRSRPTARKKSSKKTTIIQLVVAVFAVAFAVLFVFVVKNAELLRGPQHPIPSQRGDPWEFIEKTKEGPGEKARKLWIKARNEEEKLEGSENIVASEKKPTIRAYTRIISECPGTAYAIRAKKRMARLK